MNMQRMFVIIFSSGLLSLTALFGCKSDKESTNLAGPVAPPLTNGDLYGRVKLFDEDSYQPPNYGEVTISIDSTNITTICSSDGSWRLNDLKPGTYTLVFSNPGYGTSKIYGFKFVGGGSISLWTINLGNIARYYVNSISASFGKDSILTISGTISSSPLPGCYHQVKIVLDTSSAVSWVHYFAGTGVLITEGVSFSHSSFRFDGISGPKFPSGAHVYIIAYGYGSGLGTYYDPILNTMITPTQNPIPSSVFSVIVP